jgi:hypothetical protein
MMRWMLGTVACMALVLGCGGAGLDGDVNARCCIYDNAGILIMECPVSIFNNEETRSFPGSEHTSSPGNNPTNRPKRTPFTSSMGQMLSTCPQSTTMEARYWDLTTQTGDLCVYREVVFAEAIYLPKLVRH